MIKQFNFFKKHIKENLLIYSLIILCFLIGLSVGAFTVKIVDKHQKDELFYYLKDFFYLFYNSELDSLEILKQSFMNNLQILILSWFLGALIITAPIVLGVIGFKGFIIGFTVALLIEDFKFWGILIFLFGIIPQNIIIILAFIIATALSLSFAGTFLKTKLHKLKNANFFKQLLLYSSLYCLIIIIIFISAIIEAYISPVFIRLLVKNII